jgi:hypothetical protein
VTEHGLLVNQLIDAKNRILDHGVHYSNRSHVGLAARDAAGSIQHIVWCIMALEGRIAQVKDETFERELGNDWARVALKDIITATLRNKDDRDLQEALFEAHVLVKGVQL